MPVDFALSEQFRAALKEHPKFRDLSPHEFEAECDWFAEHAPTIVEYFEDICALERREEQMTKLKAAGDDLATGAERLLASLQAHWPQLPSITVALNEATQYAAAQAKAWRGLKP